ncbi:MAG: hypothetical protein V3R20_05450 [Sphingomonadales bacterium]
MRTPLVFLIAGFLLFGSFPALADTYKIINEYSHAEGKTYRIKCGRGSEHEVLHYFRLGSDENRFYYRIRGLGGWDTLDEAAKELCDKS